MPTVVSGDFEWDADKATTNVEKHGVSFEEAAVALFDPNAVEAVDFLHDERLITLALNPATGVLYVVSAEGAEERTRIISARKANPNEKRRYQNSRRGG
jgi:uncharacterized DUF497 family protein